MRDKYLDQIMALVSQPDAVELAARETLTWDHLTEFNSQHLREVRMFLARILLNS